MATIEQKCASNPQILLKFCFEVIKIEYICMRIPLRAFSKNY